MYLHHTFQLGWLLKVRHWRPTQHPFLPSTARFGKENTLFLQQAATFRTLRSETVCVTFRNIETVIRAKRSTVTYTVDTSYQRQSIIRVRMFENRELTTARVHGRTELKYTMKVCTNKH